MIGSGKAIGEFIDRIAALAEGAARRDYQVLLERARRDDPDTAQLTAADSGYYAELVRRERFDVDAQQVRQYLTVRARAGGSARRHRPTVRRGRTGRPRTRPCGTRTSPATTC